MRSSGCKSIVRIINRWGERVGKYQAGDKVAIRKDLIIDKWYDGLIWCKWKERLKHLDYVVIVDVYGDGIYMIENGWVNGWVISDLMIEGVYQYK